jgi:two-component system response regulator AtoC
MEKQGINLFIVDDNKLLAADLKHYLLNRFGADIQITIFSDGESCLEKIDNETHIVILDYYMDGKNGLEILKLIKAINPKTEVIMLSGNEDMAIAIQTFRNGAKDYVIKGDGAMKKLTKLVQLIITEPIRIMIREFGISKYMAIFLLTFVTMGAVTLTVLQMMK